MGVESLEMRAAVQARWTSSDWFQRHGTVQCVGLRDEMGAGKRTLGIVRILGGCLPSAVERTGGARAKDGIGGLRGISPLGKGLDLLSSLCTALMEGSVAHGVFVQVVVQNRHRAGKGN